MLKIRAFDNNQEKLIPLSDVTGSVTRGREVVEVVSIVGSTITLPFAPLINSEFVALNGLFLTEGVTCDYTISGNVITFNGGVLTNDGHVLINYSY